MAVSKSGEPTMIRMAGSPIQPYIRRRQSPCVHAFFPAANALHVHDRSLSAGRIFLSFLLLYSLSLVQLACDCPP
ncbi:uncharacterized protein PHACADRAFT_162615 [Phanerochaete carnosa HHB-10118-sp]|uniref:Uncharacterized protein n=1 Tax=Phanerochaete carnosa (strain HHB-10118-sp) TaxID=650164 RepID=K5UW05_PHACS|nr:uncharacterized protein PHACADRAFT_162615 [Phanerochaete carnosa HHB-10118-sp]EKM54231.1 hypothetical protein PHACADRAFT_162615 [Phanerochaete carnosa HHB-10118-sp]